MDDIGVGLVGAGLISDQHALAFQRVKGARVLAVADPDRPELASWPTGTGSTPRTTTSVGSWSARTWTSSASARPTTCTATSRWLRLRRASTSSARSPWRAPWRRRTRCSPPPGAPMSS